jgi:UDP-2,3-diacylglucosamine hydrolase
MTALMTTPEDRGVRIGSSNRVALIAGSGQLPVDVASGLAEKGHPPFVIMVKGEALERTALEIYNHEEIAPEEAGDLVPMLKRNQITHLVMAGGVSRRPNLRRIKWSLSLLRVLPKVIYALARGDNTLLSALVEYIEANGIKVIGAHEILPNLLAREGLMSTARPSAADTRDVEAALEAALAIGRLDVGQAAVSIGGRPIALEGIEGTDGLLERVKDLRTHGRLAGIGRGVLVKCAKPGQEVRADLPTIGPATIERAHAARLAGVAVEAERTFVLEFGKTVERANALGLFLVGFPKVEW